MDQDTQKTSNIGTASANVFDDSAFDELWNISLNTGKESSLDSDGNTQLGLLDWDDIKKDDGLWDGIEESASTLGKAVEKYAGSGDQNVSEDDTANKARTIASSLFKVDLDKGFVSTLHHGDEFLNKVELEENNQEEYKSEKEVSKGLFDELMTEVMSMSDKKKNSVDTEAPKSADNIEIDVDSSDQFAEVKTTIVDEEKADIHDEDLIELSDSNDSDKRDVRADEDKDDAKSDESDEDKDDAKSDESDEDKDDAKSDESENSTEDLDEENGEIHLSERARMGRMFPEGDVVVSEHELHADFYYPEEVITEEVKNAQMSSPKKRRSILVPFILLAISLGLLIGFLFISNKQVSVHYAQKGTFQSKGQYTHIFASEEGHKLAMCSDTHGVVEVDGVPVSEFWPQRNGCREVRLSKDGSVLWFVNAKQEMFEVNLEKDTGFNPKKVALLAGKDREGFDVDNNEVVYFARQNEVTPVIRRLSLQNGLYSDEVLPDDAFLCRGLSVHNYAYLSKDSLYLFDNGHTAAVSLETPKLTCPRDFLINCVSDEEGNWSVLCRNSIRQGKGTVADEPVQIEDDVALRSGIRSYQLLRNDKGTDFVANNHWSHVDNRNQMTDVKLSEKLDKKFVAVRTDDPENPIVGASNGTWFKISKDGQIIRSGLQNARVLGTAFVGDGTHVASFSQNAKLQTTFALWDLHEARIVESAALPASIHAINVSHSGALGFIITGQETKTLDWMTWNTGQKINSIVLSKNVSDASWSDDEKHILLTYEDGSRDLFEYDKDIHLVRSYSPEIMLAFAHNDLMWRIEKGNLMAERIGDGALSVLYDFMFERINSIEVKGIASSPRSDDVVFYGNKGIVILNVATKQPIKIETTQPVEWVTFDRQGNSAATSVGIVELSTGSIQKLPADLLSHKLHWAGSSHYLVDVINDKIIEATTGDVKSTFSSPASFSIIGDNSGIHPTANVFSYLRDNKIAVEKWETSDNVNTIAVFSGDSNLKWCWLASNGTLQGQGSECRYQLSDDDPSQSIPAHDPSVLANMKQISSIALPAFKPAEMAFIDDVSLSINTIPANASLVFASAEGELPKELVFESGLASAPLNVSLKRDSRVFAIVLIAERYEQRTLTFVPDKRSVTLRIPMLPEGAGNIQLVWLDNEDFSVVEVPENLDIELKSMIHERREDLRKCLRQTQSEAFSLVINDDDQLAVPEGLGDALITCITPIISDIQSMASETGGLPELATLDNIRIGIAIP